MTKVAVVILNYNGEKLLREFLPSVILYSPQAEVIVADNGSTDASVSLLKKEFPQVKLILLDKNYGFCGGYNRAIDQVDATYTLLLNSDVEVTRGWLDPMIDLLDRNAGIAAVQPKILSYYHKTAFEYAGAGGGFIDALGYPYCRGRVFQQVEKDEGQYNDVRPVFWATGACLFIRTKTFKHFGGFDEDFFAHMEEIDLCWKINRTDQKAYYCGESVVYHVGAGTLGYESPRKTYLNFRNGLFLLFKHLDPLELIYKMPLRFLLDWLAAAIYAIKGQPAHTASILKAHIHFLRSIPVMWRKRRAIRDTYPAYSRACIHPGLIIIDYYLKRNKAINSPK